MKKLNKDLNNNVVKFPKKLNDGEREVEAIIFAAAEPLYIDTIESKISKKIDVEKILKKIQSLYSTRGINLVCISNRWSFRTAKNLSNLMSNEKSVEQLYNFSKEHFDSIDILVNNAGIHMDNILLRMKTNEWQKVLDVNLNGPFYLTRILLKDMIKSKSGRIINISSISGTDGNKGQSNYSASKGGLLAFTKSLAKEVGRRNITVNCIAPGVIETDMIAHLTDTVKKNYLDRIPLKKFGKPEDIGKMILFLSSDEASYITGQTFYIDGGISLN